MNLSSRLGLLEAVQLLQQKNNRPLSTLFELLGLVSLVMLTAFFRFDHKYLSSPGEFGNAQFDLKTATLIFMSKLMK